MQQYGCIALQNTIWGIEKRSDIPRNIAHIGRLIDAAIWVSSLEAPVKLVTLAESAFTGFTDEIFNMTTAKAIQDIAIDIPGEETELLGQICQRHQIYLIANARARDLDLWPAGDRYFNVAFMIDPVGNVIHKHYKTSVYQREHTTCPHDIWDRFVEIHGIDPEKLVQALFPVTRTEIGNIGTLVCMEGSYPEASRALALNGAEIIYRPSYVEPWVSPSTDVWTIQNRSHAISNTCYVVAPNMSQMHTAPWQTVDPNYTAPFNIGGGRSMVIDYRGRVLHECSTSGDGYSAAVIDIDALREFRIISKFQNFLKDLRIEQYQLIYDAAARGGGIFPANLHMKEPPKKHRQTDEIFAQVKRKLVERGIWSRPEGLTNAELDTLLDDLYE